VLPGLVLEFMGALALGQVMRGFILGVPAADAVTFTVVPLTITAFVVLACAVPASSTARLEPVAARRRSSCLATGARGSRIGLPDGTRTRRRVGCLTAAGQVAESYIAAR
jgi:hypothetical protein